MNFKKDNRGIAKSAVIIIIAIVAALAIGGAIFASIMMKKDPLTRLITGYMKWMHRCRLIKITQK